MLPVCTYFPHSVVVCTILDKQQQIPRLFYEKLDTVVFLHIFVYNWQVTYSLISHTVSDHCKRNLQEEHDK